MGTSKRYNSVLVKDNYAPFLPTSPIFGVRQSNCVIKIYPLTTTVAIATIQKLQNFALQPMEISNWYNLVSVKDNYVLFAPNPLFSGPGYLMVSLIFLP